MVEFSELFSFIVLLTLHCLPKTSNTQVHHKMSNLVADKIAERHKIGRRYIHDEGELRSKHSGNLRGSGNYSEFFDTQLQKTSSEDIRSAVTDPIPLQSLPHIDPYHSTNITALAGTNTKLNCRVYRLGNKTVSWMRQDHLHLLTVGRYTYTSDLRFEAKHEQHSSDWSLILNSAQSTDSGQYQCQISTTPIITHNIWLTVNEPSTEIQGAPQMYVSVGSTINITCVINNAATFPNMISWYHNATSISYSGPRQGVSMITDKSPSAICVTLIISTATSSDSGTYVCKPSDNLPSANITVNVLEQTDYTAMLSGAHTFVGEKGINHLIEVTILLMYFLLVQL